MKESKSLEYVQPVIAAKKPKPKIVPQSPLLTEETKDQLRLTMEFINNIIGKALKL